MPTSSLAMGQLLHQVSHRGSIPTSPTLPLIPRTANGRAVLESRTRVACVVLLDCAPSARHTRLTEMRGQPELSTLQMDCWAIYLCGQARTLDLRVVDSTSLAIDAVANALAVHVVTPLFEAWNPPNQRDLLGRLPDKLSGNHTDPCKRARLGSPAHSRPGKEREPGSTTLAIPTPSQIPGPPPALSWPLVTDRPPDTVPLTSADRW